MKFLDLKWNFGSFYAKSELLASKKFFSSNPIIVHYTGKYKAWNYENINQYAYLYHKYYEMWYTEKFEYNNIGMKEKIIKKTKLFFYNFFLTRKIIFHIRNNLRK